jgi:hypothetical protein
VTLLRGGCRVYWGSHGCMFKRKQGPHICDCCGCEDHANNPSPGCVGAPPYYGPDTHFYGEDFK